MQKRILVYLLICLFVQTALYARVVFDTLWHIAAYAQTLPEAVKNESSDEFRPIFNRFNATHKVGYGQRLLSLFGFKQYMDSHDFVSSMKRITHARELEGNFGDFVCKTYITDNTNWFMWGSLYGAFHTFVRTLQYLKESRIIDDALCITQADTYFVFTDSFESYTPYGLETLWLLLLLLERNPGKVFVLKTMSAQTDSFRRYNIVNEFSVRFAGQADELELLLRKFSNTLALALYVISKDNTIVRISALQDASILNDVQWSYFFEDRVKGCFKIKDIERSDQKVSFASSIHLQHAPSLNQKISRLQHTQDEATHVWKLFSVPIEPFRSIFTFPYDAFVELITEKYFSNWQLSVWSHNLARAEGFQKVRAFNLESGKIIFSLNPQERIDFLEQQIVAAQAKEQEIKQRCADNQNVPAQTEQ